MINMSLSIFAFVCGAIGYLLGVLSMVVLATYVSKKGGRK